MTLPTLSTKVYFSEKKVVGKSDGSRLIRSAGAEIRFSVRGERKKRGSGFKRKGTERSFGPLRGGRKIIPEGKKGQCRFFPVSSERGAKGPKRRVQNF